jgi:hypothetical protein
MLDLETQVERIDATGAIKQAMLFIRNDPKLAHIAKLPEDDLRTICSDAVQSISVWNAGEDLAGSIHWFYRLGRFGDHHNIPVPEVVHLLAELRSEAAADDAETFIEVARYYVIRGYEDARR